MRKYIATFMIMALLVGLMPLMMPVTAEAQTYVQRYVDRRGRVRYRRVAKPSYYRRHRNRINMAAGTGLGGSALYTYKIKPKKRKYRKIRRY
jgi:hypothetical protein